MTDYSPGTQIGPGNVISANLIGVFISGASATGLVIRDNLIGTDSTGDGDLGNAQDGIQIVNASGNTIEGDNLASQVISGNLVGIEVDGQNSTGNLIEGNLIGTAKSGAADLELEPRDFDRRRVRQHGGRNDGGGAQRDLGRSMGNSNRRRHGRRKPD